MDAIKQQLLRIQQQLTGLSASQKMLTASLVVIMIMTMFYWSHYASSSEMSILLDQAMSADEITQIKTSLSAKSIHYEVNGDRIMVPSDKRFEILAELGYDQLLPHDTKSGFDDVIAQMSPLDPSGKTEQFFNHAKERTLSGLISRWPGVKIANVMIDGTRKLSPVRSINPTASIDITMKPGEKAGTKLAEAAADLLCGSQSGLDRAGVKITVNGAPLKLADPNDPFGGEDNAILDARTKFEHFYVEKIMTQVPEGTHATVSVDLKTQSSTLSSHTVDPKGKVEALKRQTTVSSDNSQGGPPQGEPGVAANVGVATDQGTTSTSSSNTMEKTELENITDTSYKNEDVKNPAGDGVAVAASIRVPDSYYRKIWKAHHSTSTADPTDADIDAIAKREMPDILSAVKATTNIKDDAAIAISTYTDIDEPVVGGDSPATGLASLPVSVGFGAKDIAVGALAVISLFMVSMMVRKSAPQPLLQPAMLGGMPPEGSFSASSGTSTATAPTAMGESSVAGEVREGSTALIGHELPPDVIEANQVIEQVGTMVKENPEAAANLVKRWLSRE